MPFLLSNPFGLFALLGIPAILLIHFLQRQSQSLPSSTLFLLDAIDRQSIEGRKIDRLRNSLPLWLQILGVLLFTWLLVEPRWDRESFVQRIVVVIDSSASMQAFQEESLEAVQREIPSLTTPLNEVSLTLIESHDDGQALYRGDSMTDLLEAIRNWEPIFSAHSPEGALRVGRSLAGAEGTLIFLTDHATEPPYGASLLAVGSPIENVGFLGSRVVKREGETAWEVSVKNHGRTPQTREWRLGMGDQVTEPRPVTLQPGEVRTLSGRFPDEAGTIRLLLEPDAFRSDDILPLLSPTPKEILTAHSVEPDVEPLVASLIESLDNAPLFGTIESESNEPDLVFSTYNPLDPRDFPSNSVVFLHQKSVPREFFSGLIAAENHPLMSNLNWQGLIARKTPSIPAANGDRVLLWQGNRPLIVLREQPDRHQLLFNFDVAQSNAARLPAFVILIHRFVDRLREDKVGYASENFELGQSLSLAVLRGEDAPDLRITSGNETSTLPPERAPYLEAPHKAGVFLVHQGENLLLRGTTHFADTREADFSEAMSRSDLQAATAKVRENQTVIDPWWPAWIIAMMVLAITIWAVLSRPSRRPELGIG